MVAVRRLETLLLVRLAVRRMVSCCGLTMLRSVLGLMFLHCKG